MKDLPFGVQAEILLTCTIFFLYVEGLIFMFIWNNFLHLPTINLTTSIIVSFVLNLATFSFNFKK